MQRSPTPFHCVRNASEKLSKAGFVRASAGEALRLRPGAKYWLAQDGHLVAFRLGSVAPATGGIRMLAAHTDSPGLRLQPRLAAASATGHTAFGVEVYGSPLCYTWLDRDLTLAGRVVLEQGGRFTTRLVHHPAPIARISSLAIHFDRSVNERGLVLNPARHLRALFGDGRSRFGNAELGAWLTHQLGVPGTTLRGHELYLVDSQPPARAGLRSDLICGSRIDNLAMCHAALCALISARAPTQATQLVVLFDHEEIGSQTEGGADGCLLERVLEQLASGQRGGHTRALAKSSMLSADMGHAWHPNYPDRHLEDYAPRLNAGPMLKTSAQRRFGSHSVLQARVRWLCERQRIPLQEYVHRPDLQCGSTVGPKVAAQLGIPVVDVGCPMLSMHSLRETSGALDHAPMVALLSAFLKTDR